MDALGSQQPTVAMVTKQDQFLTLSRKGLQTSVSPDGQPDDLFICKNTQHRQTGLHTFCQYGFISSADTVAGF